MRGRLRTVFSSAKVLLRGLSVLTLQELTTGSVLPVLTSEMVCDCAASSDLTEKGGYLIRKRGPLMTVPGMPARPSACRNPFWNIRCMLGFWRLPHATTRTCYRRGRSNAFITRDARHETPVSDPLLLPCCKKFRLEALTGRERARD